MVKTAEKEFYESPCWFGRAIVPHNEVHLQWERSGCKLDDDLEEKITRVTGFPSESGAGFIGKLDEMQALFSDGSGGPRWAPQPLTQTGSGAAAIKIDHSKRRSPEDAPIISGLGLVFSPTPGAQTVPRAEGHASTIASRACPEIQKI